MKYNSIYNNFGSGELSRYVKGRTDLEEYFKGVAEMTNFTVIRQGGASFRPGTVIVPSTDFTLPVTASKVFEFSPRDNEKYAVLLEPGRPIQVIDSNGNGPTVITTPSYPWNRSHIFSSSTYAYNLPSDDEAHRLIVDSLQVATSSDVMIIVDGTGELAPIIVARIDFNTFIVDSFISPSVLNASNVPYLYPPVPPLRVPYRDVNINTNIRLVPSATSGTITITAQDATATPITFFEGNVVGMFIKINHGLTTGIAIIDSKVSDSVVNASVIVPFGAATAQTSFETSQWNPVDGYPRSICFHEGRLDFGGNKKFPDMVWCSVTGNIYHFMQRRLVQDSTTDASGLNFFGTIKLTDAFNFIPASVGANNIQWLYPSDSLLIGTTGNEFSVTGGQEASISVSSIFVKNISSHGSSKVQPVKIGSSVLFVSADGKRVLEIPKRLVEYNSATDWTGLAAGIVEKAITNALILAMNPPGDVNPLDSKIVSMAWDESQGILWCVCKNNSAPSVATALISLTVDKTSKVVAWSKHKLGGNPFIVSVSSIPDITYLGSYRVFLSLKRPGATNYSIESISYRNNYDSFLPSEIVSSGPPVTIHLDGAFPALTTMGVTDSIEIQAMQLNTFASGSSYGVIEISSDIGTYLGEFEEVSGYLSIPVIDPAKKYIVGALYEGEIKTMAIEAGAQFGVSQGSPRRSHELIACFDRSLGGVYKASKANNEFSIIGSKGSPTVLFSGEVKLSLNASPDDHQTVIKQTLPYPLTILWLLHKGYTYDV